MSENTTTINWFPGHMTKALRQMESEIKNVDIILYCLDARAPLSCLNPKLSTLTKNKKIVFVLCKADFVNENDLKPFEKILNNVGDAVVSVNAVKSNSAKSIFQVAKKLLASKIEQKHNVGIDFSPKAMVVGVPNVGKSSLINNLCGVAKTQTGNKPGVTKGKQWVVTNGGLVLLDTPGTLWPSFEDAQVARNLAYVGSIKDEVLDTTELALSFLQDVCPRYKNLFEKRYEIQITNESPLQIFEKICFAKKCVLKKAEPDFDRCAKMILDDFRKGRLGKIILDQPVEK